MTDKIRRQEIDEAIRAGDKALISLRLAQEKLSSAKNWGILDILGGGLITNMVKHSKINDASSYLREAKDSLRVFQRELKDIPDFTALEIDIGSFLSFADFFFDGFIADYMVQTKISDAKDKINEAIIRVESLLRELKAYR
ncbi:MAG: hypothetical protein HFG68_06505 [Hungatella sp.]|nr:hypothetical protein [Hungatella sp.]